MYIYTYLKASELLRACERVGIRYRDVQDFLKNERWCFPHAANAKAKQLHRVFDSHRHSSVEPSKVRCSASELLGLYGLLRHFVEIRVGENVAIAAELLSFKAACEALDLIMIAKRGVAPAAEAGSQLQLALVKHMRLHIAAYGTQFIRPKHHWQLDMSEQVGRDGCVLDAFIIERLHLRVKRIAELVKNTTCFERSVLSGVLNNAFKSSVDRTRLNGLQGPTIAWPSLPNVLLGDRMEIFAVKALLLKAYQVIIL